MHIDRCTCHNRRFKDILATARANDCTEDVERAMALSDCGRNCAVCHAFIRETLRTGRTDFDAFPDPAD